MATLVSTNLKVSSQEEMQAQAQQYIAQGFKMTMQTERSIILNREEKLDYVIIAVLLFACFLPGIIYYLVKKDKLKNEMVTLSY